MADVDLRAELESVLAQTGLDREAVTVFADAALLAGAVSVGDPVTQVGTTFVPASVRDAQFEGIQRQPGEPGSVTRFCRVADRAQTSVEAINQVLSRLERVRLVAVAEGVTAMGEAELARRDLSDPSALSRTARERWRSRAKTRVRQDLGPATGWSKAETATQVAVATAPAAFRSPVMSALSRGTVPWVLVRGLWRACDKARLSAADAAHVATVMLVDDPESCVPERLGPDGSAQVGPWGHAAFWTALDREVSRLAACPDPDDAASQAAAEAARAAREAAYAARSMSIRVNDDGTAQVVLTGTVLKVVALGDRLDRAARAARGAGDARTIVQLANDIGLALLGHATIGAHELPDLDIFHGRQPTPADLEAGGWTPQVIAALSGLPAAVLQVVVPLLALHDPATAHLLPGATRGTRSAGRGPGDAHRDGADNPGRDVDEGRSPGHTGAAGCPACLPSARAARNQAADEESRRSRGPDNRPGRESCGQREGHGAEGNPALSQDNSAGESSALPPVPRLAWVGRSLGRYGAFLPPDQVRQLALSPGSTLVRLIVDPADGRCLERTSTSYAFDAAMRIQLAAADVTCRGPGCTHPAGACQADHVSEYGTPGGQTRESNAQLVDLWHHDPKTAKAWDAVLHANRDVTWTTTLSRVYRTRVHDYRELVTVVTDALERVVQVSPADRQDQMNAEVYQALCYRGAGERLNEGDDDPDDLVHLARFGGDIAVSLSHTDRATGRRAPGPSTGARARADAAAAVSRTAPAGGDGRDTRQGARDPQSTRGGRVAGQATPAGQPTPPGHAAPPGHAETAAERLRRDEGPPPF